MTKDERTALLEKISAMSRKELELNLFLFMNLDFIDNVTRKIIMEVAEID